MTYEELSALDRDALRLLVADAGKVDAGYGKEDLILLLLAP